MKNVYLLIAMLLGAQAHADQGLRVDSLGAATGIYWIYEGVQKFNKGDVGGGTTSAALGASTALGAITLVNKANAKEMDDPVKNFMKTNEYKNIAGEIGDKKARQFVLDMNAGWTMEKLYDKYGAVYHTKVVQEKHAAKGIGSRTSEDAGADKGTEGSGL